MLHNKSYLSLERYGMKNISFAEIKDACKIIADKIKSENHEKITIVAVARGGLIPATMTAHMLGIKDIRFIRLSSYADDHQRSELIDTTCDEIPNTETTHIIDDICDSGETILYLRKKYPLAKLYTVINKNPTIKPDFAPITEPEGLWITFPWENIE